ncbi:PHD finger protein 7-like [Culicoides brevitarsis]|uniref:PHD finger protein 7-like n=1 Tax=Culicoides brevitarsis TaxID=469753 RepID=UPI00307C5361
MEVTKENLPENDAKADISSQEDEPCLVCNMTEVDDILYGPFMSQDGIRCHYFCLLFFFGLAQTGCEVKDMAGFVVSDIEDAVRDLKTKKFKCFYCGKPDPAAVCCKKVCRKRYHLPCAMKNHCLTRFFGSFDTFCHFHAREKIKHKEKPANDQICEICFEDLGPYDPVGCFQPPCCVDLVKKKENGKSYWMHYRCVMTGTRTLGYYFNCFAYSCAKKTSETKQGYLNCGIFLPKRDALYEDGVHYHNLDRPVTGEAYLHTTYDKDATLLQRTFVSNDEEAIECNYGERCIGRKLGKIDVIACHMENCENFVHVKCNRYFCDYKSNEEARSNNFFCKDCLTNSCLGLI